MEERIEKQYKRRIGYRSKNKHVAVVLVSVIVSVAVAEAQIVAEVAV